MKPDISDFFSTSGILQSDSSELQQHGSFQKEAVPLQA
jgi:hypothetical protein